VGPYSYLERLLLATKCPSSSPPESLTSPRQGPVPPPRPPRDLAAVSARFT
jgi:hypothetical protein